MNDTGGVRLNWQVESIRFTLFHPVTDKQFADGLWANVCGELPGSRFERPQERLVVEEGMWGECNLSVSSRPDRFDIIINQGPVPVPVLPCIGMVDKIREKISPVLDRIPFDGMTRIAFGMTLLHPEQDHEGAYKSLATLLPDVKIDPLSRDFIYQINKPVVSKTDPSVEINRLQVWSAIFLDFMAIDIRNNVRLYASRLVLDVNTASESVLSSQNNTRILMDELIDEAFAISSVGNDNAKLA